MDSHYYAGNYFLLEPSGNRKTHYTHHSDMVAPQYEWFYGASNHSEWQTFCYKHHIQMDALHYASAENGP